MTPELNTIQNLRSGAANLSIRQMLLSLLVMCLLTATAPAATVNVDCGVHEFIPSNVRIQVGDTVVWHWTTGHTTSVTSGTPGHRDGLFDSGVKTIGTFSYTFTQAGHYDYFCQVDPVDMIGSVDVLGGETASQPLNISTRVQVQTGEGAMIGGFIITGTAPKKVILRAIGPSLEQAGVAGALSDPTLQLNGAGGPILSNDDWKTTQQSDIQASGVPPTDPRESAIVATLSPGNYTGIVQGKSGATGVGLVEVYDLDSAADSKLANISTRGAVGTNSNVMIGGFILGKGTGAARILVRAIGPTLKQAGITNVLANPTLELHDANGALVRANDNWKDSQQTEIEATGIPPKDDLESAILATLPAGAYTAIVSGKSGSVGVGLVEVYQLK